MEAIGDRNSSILPSVSSHSNLEQDLPGYDCKSKAIKHKWRILLGILFIAILALVLGLTLGHKAEPDPGPPGPSPPDAYNPYVVDESSVVWLPMVVTGRMEATQARLEELNARKASSDN